MTRLLTGAALIAFALMTAFPYTAVEAQTRVERPSRLLPRRHPLDHGRSTFEPRDSAPSAIAFDPSDDVSDYPHATLDGPLGDLDGPLGDDWVYLDGHPSSHCRSRCGGILPGGIWVRGEYLLWWTDGLNTPPLVTTSPPNTARPDAGVLGRPGTTVLFGGSLNDDVRSGGRLTLGYWFDPCQNFGIEASYLTLGRETASFHSDSSRHPILARPFLDTQTGQEDAELISFPDVVEGVIDVQVSTEFQVAEVLLRKGLCRGCNFQVDALLGYRFARLDDRLRISELLVSQDPASGVAPGTTIELFDQFDTRNQFHGAQFGVAMSFRQCRWSWDLQMKLALGNTRSQVRIDGLTTTTTVDGSSATHGGGLLAQPTNIGQFQRNQFSIIPELGARLNYDVSCHWRASLGYTFLYWSQVGRAGDQIDRELNLSQLPPDTLIGPARPAFKFMPADFWAQGLNLGLEYTF